MPVSDFVLYHSPSLRIPAAWRHPSHSNTTLHCRNLGSLHFRQQVKVPEDLHGESSLLLYQSLLGLRQNTGRLLALRLLLAGHRITLGSEDLERSPCAVPLFCLPEGEPSRMTHCHLDFFFLTESNLVQGTFENFINII